MNWVHGGLFLGFASGPTASLKHLAGILAVAVLAQFQGRIRRVSSMPSADEIFDKVRDTLVDALGVDDDEVTATATLIGDLGAESIDFLDIVFRLEKNFEIKIPRGELFPENLASADSGFVADGKVTADGIAQLRQKMPHADIDSFAKDPAVSKLPNLFTVDMICKFIAARVK